VKWTSRTSSRSTPRSGSKEKEAELEREIGERRVLEEKLRELTRRGKELEDRAGVFQREAVSGSELIGELQKTLRVADQARSQLSTALERQATELARWRQDAAAKKGSVEALEARLAERDTSFAELEKRSEEAKRAALHEAAAREAETKKAIDELKARGGPSARRR